MKPIPYFTAIMLFVCIQVFGQTPNFECGTDRAHQSLMLIDSAYRAGFNLHQQQLSDKIQQQSANGASRAVITIPVVVHVIHLGEAVGVGTNIPDSIIHGAIQGINDRFRNLIGNGTTDVELEFCLASRDPNGYSTMGIVRKDGLLNIPNYANGVTQYPDSCSQSGITFADQLAVKNFSRWSPLEYYNIWVVNSICGGGQIYGFAQFPNASTTTSSNDGMVIDYLHFKYIDCSATHEMGHGFDLFHTFEGDNNGYSCPSNLFPSIQGDRCDDTPPHIRTDYQTTTCVNGNWDNSKYNYMSYTFVNTPTISYGRFTPKQKGRILASLNTSPRSYLLNSLGCTQGACPPPNNDECMGNYAAVPLTFGTSCNPISKSTCGATASGFSNCQGVQDDDVFFSFVPTTTTATITVTPSTGFDAVFQVLTGPCGTSMTQLTNGCVNSTGTGGTESVTLSGLTTGTSYFIRVWHNGVGYGTTGNFTVCAYGSSSSCATPSNTNQTNITQTSATLTWGSVASATNYTVQYRVSGTSTWTTVTISNTSFPLSNLTCNTTYEWQVRANCSSGNSSYSAVKLFPTNTCGTSCTPPSNDNCSLSVPTITSNGACVNGTVACANGSYGANQCSGCSCTSPDDKDVYYQFVAQSASHTVTLSNYASNFDGVIELRTDCAFGTAIGCIDPIGTPTTVSNTWNNLIPGLPYYIRVFEYNNTGTPPSSPTFTLCLTHSGGGGTTCNTPTGLSETNVTQSSATLNWGSVSSAINYTLQVKQLGGSWQTFNTTSTSYSFTGFACNTTYQWQVSANCANGSSAFSAIESFPTLSCGGGSSCSAPAGLNVSNIGQNSASLSWNSVPGVSYYIVRYKTGGASWTATNTNNTSFNLSGLSCNAIYEWQIEAVCTNGNYPTTGTSFTTNTCTNGCTNTFLERTVNAPTCASGLLTIYTSQWQNEYNRVNNVVSGESYVSAFSLGGWITVRYGTYNGTLVAQGSTPLTWAANQGAGTYFIHYNTNSSCGQATNPGTSTLAVSSCVVPCSSPAISITNISEFTAYVLWPAIPNATQYTFEYKKTTSSAWNAFSTIDTFYMLSGLTCGTEYEWRAYTTCSGSNSSYVLGTFTTDSCGGSGHCANAIQWGTRNAPLACSSATVTVNTYQGNYYRLDGVSSGVTYLSSFSLGGHITVRSGSATGAVVSSGSSPLIWTATISGSYYIHHNTSSSCLPSSIAGVASVSVNPPPAQPGSITGNTNICSGSFQSYSISPVAGATDYAWSYNGSPLTGTGTSVNFTTTSSGTLSVVASNSCGNSTPRTLTIAVNQALSQPGTITGDTSVCSGIAQTYSINAVSGATSYTWIFTGLGTISGTGTSISFSPISSGTLSVIANNSCGSSTPRSIAISVTQTPLVSVNPSSTTICSGGNGAVLNAVSDAQSFTWSPANGLNTTTGQTVTANPASNATYTVTAANGNCSATATSVVNVSNQFTATISPASPVICGNSSVSLTATTGTTYTWSGPNGFTDNSQTVLATAAGIYFVTVTNPDGCSGNAVATTTVTQNPSLIVDAGAFKIIQPGNTTQLGGAPTATGGTPPYTYAWNPSTALSSSSVPNPTASPTTNTIYSLTVTDASGCFATDSVAVITSLNCQTFLFDSLNINVPYDSATYSINLTTGAGCPWSVIEGCSWLTFNTTSGNGTTTLTFAAAENTLQSPRTCYVNIEGVILIITQGQATPCLTPVSDFTASQQTIVVGNTVTFFDNSTNTPSQWEWTFNGGNPATSTAQNPTVTYPNGGSFDVTLKATNSCGNNTVTKPNYINVTQTVGIDNLNFSESINIYPNPNSGTFRVSAKINTTNSVELKLFSAMGQLVNSSTIQPIANKIEKEISLINSAAGVYIIQLSVDKKPYYKKLIIE